MIVIPAVDLLGGNVVRLHKGKQEECKVYSTSPVKVAQEWQQAGAHLIHVVDLDAAFGQGDNLIVIREMLAAGLRIQVGGGIRSFAKAKQLIELGVQRVIIGSKAFERGFLNEVLGAFGDKVAVGIDVLDRNCMVSGWEESSGHEPFDFMRHLQDLGVAWIVYTDISRDGTLKGLDLAEFERFKSLEKIRVIVSGGVSSEADIIAIRRHIPFVYGVIVGKALYEKRLDLKNAINIANSPRSVDG